MREPEEAPGIRSLGRFVDVSRAVQQIDENPQFWDLYTPRTAQYRSPHDVSDIWVRYNAWENYDGDLAAFNGPHDSVWYPCAATLTELTPIIAYVFGLADGEYLGGVLITKVPPGGEVRPHTDHGWHAEFYDKYAVQLRGNDRQAFCFEHSSLSALPGEIYTFNNQMTHWVTNESDEDRMTLIICVRSHERPSPAPHSHETTEA